VRSRPGSICVSQLCQCPSPCRYTSITLIHNLRLKQLRRCERTLAHRPPLKPLLKHACGRTLQRVPHVLSEVLIHVQKSQHEQADIYAYTRDAFPIARCANRVQPLQPHDANTEINDVQHQNPFDISVQRDHLYTCTECSKVRVAAMPVNGVLGTVAIQISQRSSSSVA
jgi:hypothetical protein